MSTAHRRPKQPDRVRRALLDAAARILVESGADGLTLQAVAAGAGVTKGGLLHHFPTKEALVEAVFADLLDALDAEIDALMAADPDPAGAFTRAYVRTVHSEREKGAHSPWAAISVSMIVDPNLRRLWSAWLDRRHGRHAGSDGGLRLETVRLAADGIWLADLMWPGDRPLPDRDDLLDHLIAITRRKD